MQGATKVALVSAIGSFLQGWDNAAIAGALLYMRKEFNLASNPALEGLLVAAALIGSWCMSVCAGPAADWIGRKLVLVGAACLYCISACVMLWSPNVYCMIVARIIDGLAIGLVVTSTPIYIAEVAPAEIRGQLATFPQLMGSAGLFLSYIMVFSMSLSADPAWRLMLGVLLLPSLVYLGLLIFYLPESPRWLVSKGRMLEARNVLKRLRDREDVSAELALLVEGLGTGTGDAQLEEWMLKPAPEESMERAPSMKGVPSMKGGESQIKLFAPEEGIAWIATPVVEEPAPRGSFVHGSFINVTKKGLPPLVDPVVSLIGSVQHAQEHYQEHLEEQQHQEEHLKENEEDEEERHDLGDEEEGMVGNFDESTLQSPLLPRRTDSKRHYERENSGAFEGDIENQIHARHQENAVSHGSMPRHGSMVEAIGSVGIGGGWQLAWQWVEPEGPEEEGGFKRVFLLQEPVDTPRTPRPGGISTVSLPKLPEGDAITAAAIVGQPAQYVKEAMEETAVVGPVMLHPAQTALHGPAWSDLLVGGVRRALIVGLGLQILQQLSGINAVLYFVPQILQQSGLAAVLTNAGISTDSASILGSGVTALFMIPCIFLAMYLMDRTGRRQLLLSTLPVLLFSLIIVTISNSLLPTGLVQATVSFLSVTLYVCSFVMGFGPIPNILCSEIFPTRVRGLCIGICQATFWTFNIIVTYMFPLLLAQIGLSGVFSVFAVVCLIAWVFIFLKVPETKGMPLEVISEFFAMTHLDKKAN